MKTTKKDYVEVVYNEADKPFTTYPKKLATYLSSRFDIKKDYKLLELDCGRGEFLNSFIDLGIDGYGTDISDYSKKKYPKIKFTKNNILEEKKYLFLIIFLILLTQNLLLNISMIQILFL